MLRRRISGSRRFNETCRLHLQKWKIHWGMPQMWYSSWTLPFVEDNTFLWNVCNHLLSNVATHPTRLQVASSLASLGKPQNSLLFCCVVSTDKSWDLNADWTLMSRGIRVFNECFWTRPLKLRCGWVTIRKLYGNKLWTGSESQSQAKRQLKKITHITGQFQIAVLKYLRKIMERGIVFAWSASEGDQDQ
jgi:hypothetical protein